MKERERGLGAGRDDELDYQHPVHGRRSVPDASANARYRLVEGPNGARESGFFPVMAVVASGL
jgi:hypothetical protein